MSLQTTLIRNMRYCPLVLLLLGTTLIPGGFVVGNLNLVRNYFFTLVSFALLIGAIMYRREFQCTRMNALLNVFLCGLISVVIRNPTDKITLSYVVAFVALLTFFNMVVFNKVHIARCVILICTIETLICCLQYINAIFGATNTHLISGTFENPNTYGLFVSLCVPFIIFSFKQVGGRFFSVSLITIILIMLVLMKCRMALLCVSISILLMYIDAKYIKSKQLLLLLPIFLVVSLCEYQSSLGRLLILIVSFMLFIKMPLCGYGVHGFTKFYMNEQANALDSGVFKYFIGLEGVPMNPLNEYVTYVLNVGYIGLFILVSVFLALC